MGDDISYFTDSEEQYEQDPEHAILTVDIPPLLEEDREDDELHNPTIDEYGLDL